MDEAEIEQRLDEIMDDLYGKIMQMAELTSRHSKANLDQLAPDLRTLLEAWLDKTPDMRAEYRTALEANSMVSPHWSIAREFISDVGAFSLYGPVGVGKTYAAAAAVKALARRGVASRFVAGPDLAVEFRTAFDSNEGPHGILKRYSHVPVLVIDDFDKIQPSPFVAEMLFNLVDTRYVNELPIAITSNSTPSELLKKFSRFPDHGEAIIDRLRETTPLWLELSGSSRRLKHMREGQHA